MSQITFNWINLQLPFQTFFNSILFYFTITILKMCFDNEEFNIMPITQY
jgi:hypothetical protein